MPTKIKLVALILCCILLSACAAPVLVGNEPDPKVLQEARQQYRNSSLIVRGVCVQTHIDSTGAMCYDLQIIEVLAGTADAGDIIHSTKVMNIDEEYLLYLSEGEDVLHAEDVNGYTMQAGPLPITGDSVLFEGSSIELTDLVEDIEQIKDIVVAPANTYYQKELAELVNAADEIFIGKVVELPPLKELPFRTSNKGAITESNPLASIAKIYAYGSIKGNVNYGDSLELVYNPDRTANVLDAETLAAITTNAPVPQLEEGGLYLLFLNYGPDVKQPYLFPVNVYQGFVKLRGDTLYVPAANTALLKYESLIPLVQDMREVIGS